MSRETLVLLGVLFVSTSCAGSSPYMKTSEDRPSGPAPGKALVYVVRPSGMGYGVDFQIWDGDHCIGVAVAKSCFSFQSAPGKHLFMAISENKSAVDAELAAGRTYYLIARVGMGGWRARVELIPVTRGSEYWEEAEVWARELIYTEADRKALAEWEVDKREEAREIMATFRTEKGREYVTPLPAAAGR